MSQTDELTFQEWNCLICTYSNISQSSHCAMCGNPKPIDDNEMWSCARCTYANKKSTLSCEICGASKSSNTNDWNCTFCTFTNKPTHSKCQICNNTKSNESKNDEMKRKNRDISKLESKLFQQQGGIKGVDPLVFKRENISCNKNNYKNCTSITRLLVALKCYSTLDIIGNDNDANVFREFIHDIYHELVNDYIHFNNEHSHELEHINNELLRNNNECAISVCTFARRHHNAETNTNNLDDILNFYSQTMASLHFYLFHCYDAGIRTKQQNEIAKEEKSNDQYFDAKFSRISGIISERTHSTQGFDRFSSRKNGKFNIEAEQEIKNNDNDTFLDAVYEHLQIKNVKKSDIKKVYHFIQDEEYETDTIVYDADMKNSNIAKNTGNDECIETIQTLMQLTTVHSTSFSIGLRFYYWPYYKQRQEIADEQEITIGGETTINNYNEHSGYSICDLFIVPRYGSFKE
eukprot:391805_1